MAFEKGKPKTGGRKKGVKNVATTTTKRLISNLLKEKFSKFVFEMGELQGKEFVTAYLKLIEYEMPKAAKQTISFKDLTEEEAKEVIDQLREKVRNEQ